VVSLATSGGREARGLVKLEPREVPLAKVVGDDIWVAFVSSFSSSPSESLWLM